MKKLLEPIVQASRAAAALLLGASLFLPGAARAQWLPVGKLQVPSYNYLFLAATPSGDLLAATFNSSGEPGRRLPALLIQRPLDPEPRVVELCNATFDSQRGYGGIACHPSGSFFVSGDTGQAATCFIRKFLPTGQPDASFAQAGELVPGRRCLGLDVFSDYLLAAVDWGVVNVYDARSGAYLSAIPKSTGAAPFVRDIAIDPKSMRIFGVAGGGIVTWGKGSPWNAAAYQFRSLTPSTNDPRSGEGISIDPMRRTVLITPVPGNILKEIQGNGATTEFTVTSAAPDAHLADSVMSFDGTTLFISDMRGMAIHRMKRNLGAEASTVNYSAVAGANTGTVAQAQWQQSYEQVVQAARTQGKPMLVYFRMGSAQVSKDFEASVLKSDAFNQQAQKFVCVFEDLDKNRLLAYKFGVFRVPHVTILDRHGEQTAEFRSNIKPDRLLSAMQTAQQ